MFLYFEAFSLAILPKLRPQKQYYDICRYAQQCKFQLYPSNGYSTLGTSLEVYWEKFLEEVKTIYVPVFRSVLYQINNYHADSV
jgi:hypothetical protein